MSIMTSRDDYIPDENTIATFNIHCKGLKREILTPESSKIDFCRI